MDFDSVWGVYEYLTLEPLAARIDVHRRFSERPDDVEGAVLDAVPLRPEQSLLDIGSGTGSFLGRIAARGHRGRLVGVDTSPEAVASLRHLPGVTGQLGDAMRLPYADGAFSVVTARHMLYHVPDVDRALREARRVLAPGGRFAATVNHPDAVPRVSGLVLETVTAHGVRVPVVPRTRVHSDNLPGMMARAFGPVTVHRYDNALVFPEPRPLVIFAVALLSFYGVPPSSPHRPAIARDLERAVLDWFDATGGPWRDPKGYVVCTAS